MTSTTTNFGPDGSDESNEPNEPSGFNGPKPVTASLVSNTEHPLETLYYVWQQSKHNGPMIPPSDINKLLYTDGRDAYSLPREVTDFLFANTTSPEGGAADILRQWKRDFYGKVAYLLDEEVPCGQNIDFVFQLENVPVAFREQIVRHKVGSVVDDRIGFDTVPDQVESAFWSQSHRVLDMSRFYDDYQWYQPKSMERRKCSLDENTPSDLREYLFHGRPSGMSAEMVYMLALRCSQWSYAALVNAGVPVEDARNVLPMAVTHRMTWKVNLVSIKHIIGKRSCWIMQRGFWEELIEQMVGELSVKVHPMFRRLVNPPCIHGKSGWRGCVVKQSNMDRIQGRDPNPPCPLFLNYHRGEAITTSDASVEPAWHTDPDGFAGWDTYDPEKSVAMARDRTAFRMFWSRNVDTGEPVTVDKQSADR